MTIAITMPALSPTMEEGTVARWLVNAGDTVQPGDVLAEIETDKASMEFEAADAGVITEITMPAGSEGVKVGAILAYLAVDGDAVEVKAQRARPQIEPVAAPVLMVAEAIPAAASSGVKASPLARRLAAQRGLDLAQLTGSGPHGRVVRADLGEPRLAPVAPTRSPVLEAPAPSVTWLSDIPHEASKLSNVRKTIARRLTESKQQIPHIYLTVDVRLDALLEWRATLNKALVPRGVKLSINDMIIKAQALALVRTPACNVMFTPDQLFSFSRADISVAVSTPTGLITPVVKSADTKPLSVIAAEIKELAARAREQKLKPEEYQGGTASISNLGMYGIKQFEAIINPPQAMILAVGAGERRPYVMDDDTLGVATIMSATGSFDHRAIDGADAAKFMQVFKALIEEPLSLVI